jgi:perosamine synthetase
MIQNYKPYLNLDEIKNLCNLKQNFVEEFEEEFARLVGSKYALSFPHARTALFSILKSLNIKDSEIIMPSYTCMAVPSTVINSKNIPVFTEISLEDYNISIDKLEKNITDKTKAIICVHMYGYPLDIKRIKDSLKEDILVVEDAALSVLTKDVGKHGDVTFYSLGIFKQLLSFGGGVVTTNNIEIYEKLKDYIEKKFIKNKTKDDLKKIFCLYLSYISFSRPFYKTYSLWNNHYLCDFYKNYFDSYEKHIPDDFLKKFSNIQAKIGLSQIKKAKEIIRKRQLIAQYYNKRLDHLRSKIILPPIIDGASYAEYTIRVNDRNNFEKNMLKKGVQINKIFRYSVPNLTCFKDYSRKKFVNSLHASQSVVNLPSFPNLLDKPERLEYISEAVESCIK